jgi:hypothetical protein
MEPANQRSDCRKNPQCGREEGHDGACSGASDSAPDNEKTDPGKPSWPPLDEEGFPF